ncbi:MAG: hypothetical protein ACD_21C00078G0002 [uncultured bacterium]|nr:MAG: hypothetical protein ACD_21C00078G0002 [uncultured bacterium]
MGEPAFKREASIQHSEGRSAAAAKPELGAVTGGNISPRGERVSLDVMENNATLRAEDIATDTAENATTDKNLEVKASEAPTTDENPTVETSFGVPDKASEAVTVEDVSTVIEGAEDLNAVEFTPPPVIEAPNFDLPAATTEAVKPATLDAVDQWMSGRTTFDIALKSLEIMPQGEPPREPWDEQPETPDVMTEEPSIDPETRKALEAATKLLSRGWDVLRRRINSMFEDKAGKVNDRRVFGASAMLGVVGAFALSGLLAHQMEGFQKNVENYLLSQNHLSNTEVVANK